VEHYQDGARGNHAGTETKAPEADRPFSEANQVIVKALAGGMVSEPWMLADVAKEPIRIRFVSGARPH
tara:strand:+ start:64 stop:267 length:204 start_codon:yes stop_codon:yes gene_type:complete